MNCRFVLHHLAKSHTALVARSPSFVPAVGVRLYATKPPAHSNPTKENIRPGKQSKKNKERRNDRGRLIDEEDNEIEEAETALSVADEINPQPPLTPRQANKNPIPDFNSNPEITDQMDKQQELVRWQEQMRTKKQGILKRAKQLAALDMQEVSGITEYSSIEEAYKSLKFEFDTALQDRKVDELYELINNMRSMGLRLPKKSYDAAAVLFAEEQHIYKVKDVWDFMHRDEIFPDQNSFMNVVKIYCHITQYEWAMRSFFKMCEYICPQPDAYETILELFSKNTHIGNLRKAEQIFHTIHRFDVKHTPAACGAFIRLLCSSGYEGDADRAIDVLKYMKQKVIGPVPNEVPRYFVDHIRKYALPEHHFVRVKKVLRGCQAGGLPDEPFKSLWAQVEAKKFVQEIQRADLAAPLERMDLNYKPNPNLKLG